MQYDAAIIGADGVYLVGAAAGFRIRQKADCIQVACLFFWQAVRGD